MSTPYLSLWSEVQHQPLPFQIREPVEVISNDVVFLASRAGHYHNTFVIRLLGNLLTRPGGANLQKCRSIIRVYDSETRHNTDIPIRRLKSNGRPWRWYLARVNKLIMRCLDRSNSVSSVSQWGREASRSAETRFTSSVSRWQNAPVLRGREPRPHRGSRRSWRTTVRRSTGRGTGRRGTSVKRPERTADRPHGPRGRSRRTNDSKTFL